MKLHVLELCAGGGGQALGLELAGFETVGAADNDAHACRTLRANRPTWNVIEKEIQKINGKSFRGVDLVAGGLPCPPFSIAGKQLGPDDERDLFPAALEIIADARPKAVMIENVRGFAAEKFRPYRDGVFSSLEALGYRADWKLVQASWFGVPQLRPRFILVAFRRDGIDKFKWPAENGDPPTVGETLEDLMAAGGWEGAAAWAGRAHSIAPTIVGGSKKHGGPDLGPTRAKREWAKLGVDGMGIANEPPPVGFPLKGQPRLTVRMVARLQGFPDDWAFEGGKTAAYRQVGNALPPPVATAIGSAIRSVLTRGARKPKARDLKLFKSATDATHTKGGGLRV